MSVLPGGTSTDLLYSLSNGNGGSYDAALQGLPRYLDAPPPDAAAGTPSPLALSSFTRKLEENRVFTNGKGFTDSTGVGTNPSPGSTNCGAYELGTSGFGHSSVPQTTYGVTAPAGGSANCTAPGYGLPHSPEAAGGMQAMRGRFDGEAACQSSQFQPYQRDTSPHPVGTAAPSSPMTMGRPGWDAGDYRRDGAGMPPLGVGSAAAGTFGGCGLGGSTSQPNYGVTTPAGGASSFAPSGFPPSGAPPSGLAPSGMAAPGYGGPGNTFPGHHAGGGQLLEEANAAVGGLCSSGSTSQFQRRDISPLPMGGALPMANRPGWDRAPQNWGQPELQAPFGEASQPAGDVFSFPANGSYTAEPNRDGVPNYAPGRPSPRSSSPLEGRTGSPLPDGRSPRSAGLLESRIGNPLHAGRSPRSSSLYEGRASSALPAGLSPRSASLLEGRAGSPMPARPNLHPANPLECRAGSPLPVGPNLHATNPLECRAGSPLPVGTPSYASHLSRSGGGPYDSSYPDPSAAAAAAAAAGGAESLGKLGGCSASIPPALLPPHGAGGGLGGSFSGGSAPGLGLGIDYGGCALGGYGNNYLGGPNATGNNQMLGNYYNRLPGQPGFTGPQNDSTMADSWPNGQRHDLPPGGSFAADPLNPLVPGASTSSSYVPPVPGGSGYGSPMQPLPPFGGPGGLGMPGNDSPFPPSQPSLLSPLQPGASLPPTLPSNSLPQSTTGVTPTDAESGKADRTTAREKARKDRVPTPIRPGTQARARVKRSTSRSACC
mmetsp:Transcript_67525/g.133253  ORF Transcript_67525/g.133253 Transcript_67525/m.133253 type:complete len:770 (-) Transcript_67525:180-2489(-)